MSALDELDREINGVAAPLRRRPVPARAWVEGALGRWRAEPAVPARRSRCDGERGRRSVLADPSRLAQALDNLIVNAIEHGGPPIRVDGTVRGNRLRITVADGGATVARGARRGGRSRLWLVVRRSVTRGRRGNGLRAVARIAAEHEGRFMVTRGPRGTVAALELPLASAAGAGALAA